MTLLSSFKSLRLEGVSRDFGVVNALRDLTLEIKRGEFVALLGPSGCGKSTALNCIAGLLPTTRGQIMLDDRRIDTLPTEDRGFGMVFQNYALFPHMTVRNNIGFGLKMRGIPKNEAAPRVEEAIRTVRLDTQAHKLPGQLSGGQQQRVAIARAIAIDPPLVLMDEPLSNLDAKLRLEMRQEIRRIHQSLGCITIYVTHDQDEALSLADRIVVLRDGAIRQVGAPEDLYARPAHLDVAEFMGFRNRINGRVQARDGNRVQLTVAGTTLDGVVQEALTGDTAIAAVRPDDMVPVAPDAHGIDTVVEAIEYRGRDFFGQARSKTGDELFFRSEQRLAPGAAVRLGAEPHRVLVYPGA
ncbi:ABC transporter ATP-binding protein [Alsobacter metallidurans]|uniref:ABC transporter ATP-binding protein n=1 Tax=Alsobacter metallidurans TaxID=340221 RepID=A0A917MII6_9HYPH|nr:ABC transporter ATP-binding protein [Alsobacter metallidurans]GGH20726.1 ABC transporter ATP-binding protein [Alsobacter metallidurans]